MTRTSVIVPCYNAQATVARAVRSVLAQTDGDFEIIAIDDGSSDETLRELRGVEDPRLRIVAHERNRGISAARNSGLAAATGEFLAFLDADDEWERDFLARMHAARGEGDAAVCGRTVVLPDGRTRWARSATLGTMSGEEAAIALLTCALSPYPWDKVIRRRAFDGLRYPVEVDRFEDQVVGIIALSRVDRVVSIPDALTRYHIGAGSLTWGRVPEVAEAERALGFLETELGDWLAPDHRRTALDVCRTMFLMLTVQSAMRSEDRAAARAVVAECRRRITPSMLRATLRSSPVLGAGALLLKSAPAVYRWLFTAYLGRRYALS